MHYSLGFPPYRTGGMTKFCIDLMHQQFLEGHYVALLWPGEIKFFNHHTKIKYRGSINGIESFEIKNPLPIPYDEGIINMNYFMKKGDIEAYQKLLINWKPDVVHIHTFMGLHKTFLEAAKKYKIKLVFSAHDFFPICPKVTMFYNGHICTYVDSCKECPKCNLTALSINKIKLLQSIIYRNIKDCNIIKKFRKHHRDLYLSDKNNSFITKNKKVKKNENDYNKLRKYYQSFIDYIDIVHFNSTITKKVYEKYLLIKDSVIISITHSDIEDHRIIKDFSGCKEEIRMTYLGPQGDSKGFFY